MTRASRIGPPMVMAGLLAMIVGLAACAREKTGLKDAALACQTMKCVCEEPDAGMFETPERALVLWSVDGDAYCPEGFELRSAKPRDNEFLKKYGG